MDSDTTTAVIRLTYLQDDGLNKRKLKNKKQGLYLLTARLCCCWGRGTTSTRYYVFPY
jgi:hypothetical protein